MDTKSVISKIFEDSINAKKDFAGNSANIELVEKAARTIIDCYKKGGKLLVFGNGGSAADSQHLAAEMIVRFEAEREAFPCIALTTDTSVLTATANDYDFSCVFSRQVEALASSGDVVIAISTSGVSRNVIEGVKKAKEKSAKVIALAGKDGGQLAKESDIPIVVTINSTARIQEVHGMVIHAICSIVENALKG